MGDNIKNELSDGEGQRSSFEQVRYVLTYMFLHNLDYYPVKLAENHREKKSSLQLGVGFQNMEIYAQWEGVALANPAPPGFGKLSIALRPLLSCFRGSRREGRRLVPPTQEWFK